MTSFIARAIALVTLSGCFLSGGCADTSTESVTKIAQAEVCIFSDRSDPELEYVFVLTTHGVLGQVAVFPGYAHRRFYVCPQLSVQTGAEAETWKRRPGEIAPPFVPEGPYFSRADLDNGSKQRTTIVYFKDTNHSLREWLKKVRLDVVKEEYRVETPPDWAASDKRIVEWLGLPTRGSESGAGSPQK